MDSILQLSEDVYVPVCKIKKIEKVYFNTNQKEIDDWKRTAREYISKHYPQNVVFLNMEDPFMSPSEQKKYTQECLKKIVYKKFGDYPTPIQDYEYQVITEDSTFQVDRKYLDEKLK